jgi:hypothetical protein
MLNFESNHIHIDGNLNQKKGKKLLKNVIISGCVLSSLISFSGCSKKVDCNIENEHAHYYVSEENMGRYIQSERVTVSGLNRLDNYILINEKEEDLIKFINRKDLFRIDQNQHVIDKEIENHQDFTEYRYSFRYTKTVTRTYRSGGKTRYRTDVVTRTGYSWTRNPNHENLTGEERQCHYIYYGYKIIQNEKGKYKLEKSIPYDNVYDIPKEYNYVKREFYEIMDLTKNEVADYENKHEDHHFEENYYPETSLIK